MIDEREIMKYNVEMAEHANGAALFMGALLDFSLLYIIQEDKGELKDRNSFFFAEQNQSRSVDLHRSTWGEYSMDQFNKGQMVKVEKTGFDDKHKKHVWKILSIDI